MSTAIPLSIEQNTQLLSANTLPSDLTNLASAGILTQAHALVVLRQADATGFPDPNGLTTVLTHQQGEMRDHATYFLNRLMPDTIKLFSDASAAASLFTAVRSVLLPMMDTLDSASGARAQAEQVAESFGASFDTWLDDAKDAATELDREASQVERLQATLEAAVEATVAALDGPDGEIAQATASIATLRQAIEVDLQNVVMSGKDIGDGVKNLVTGILTTIGLGKEEAPADDAKTDTAKKGAKPAAKDDEGGDDEESFPVESIDTVSDGVSKMTAAMQQFRTDNDQLATLYQQLAQMNAVLSIARAIGDQSASYATSLRDAATVAGVLVRTISGVQTGANQFADAVGDPQVPVTTLVAALNSGNTGWTRLNASLLPIRQTLAGVGTLIPPRPASVVEISAR